MSYVLAQLLTNHLQNNKTGPFEKMEPQTPPPGQETPHSNLPSSPPTVKAPTGGSAAASPGESLRLPTAPLCHTGHDNAAASSCADSPHVTNESWPNSRADPWQAKKSQANQATRYPVIALPSTVFPADKLTSNGPRFRENEEKNDHQPFLLLSSSANQTSRPEKALRNPTVNQDEYDDGPPPLISFNDEDRTLVSNDNPFLMLQSANGTGRRPESKDGKKAARQLLRDNDLQDELLLEEAVRRNTNIADTTRCHISAGVLLLSYADELHRGQA